ncbi:hypothetical protein ACFVAJ_17050 [Agromyces sp. NPDC057679]|uniref:hypothetical protein n=1 Tax=Agromyces sp. NPDC057679 TaxID=3346207 RepID=UPI00366DFEB8
MESPTLSQDSLDHLTDSEKDFWRRAPSKIVTEQAAVNFDLREGKELVLRRPRQGVPTVHLHSCPTVINTVHRESAWEGVWAARHSGKPGPAMQLPEMPTMMSVAEVEKLESYTACNRCSPPVQQVKKRRQFPTTPTKLSSLAPKHIDREFMTLDGEPVGKLQSYTVHREGVTLSFHGIEIVGAFTDQIIVMPETAAVRMAA